MGFWPFSRESRADAIRSGDAIPNRQERKICWAARDAYFNCLDAHNIVDATKDPSVTKKACPVETADFERDCAAAWVKYFKQWRVADIQKKRRLEELRAQGAQEMTVTTSFAPEGGAGEKGKGVDDIQAMLDKKR
ncbi:cytochrome c subunit vib [Fusarium beomiforme]|uniref:Cytochrome c subunit vib n=1 Tax=Fusarium beomiforme TaxID=44412 RepID=A0A9P5A9M8_9HYPO|nr:cytochrome c subunit vib [Fusarium beomiforme]